MTRYLKKRSKQIRKARQWAIELILASVGITHFISEIQRIQEHPYDLMLYAYLALLLLTGILIILWYLATEKELDLLFKWLNPQSYDPPSDLTTTSVIVGVGLLLSMLIFASRNPLVYGSIFSIYSFVLIFEVRILNRELESCISQSRNRQLELLKNGQNQKDKLYLEGIEILNLYFLKRHHVLRNILVFIFSLVGLVFAIYWGISGLSLFGIAAYLTFSLTIIVSEIVIGSWRNIRNKNLRPLDDELREVTRETKSSALS